MIPRYGFIVNSYVSAPKASKLLMPIATLTVAMPKIHTERSRFLHRWPLESFLCRPTLINLSMQIQSCVHTITEAALSITFSQKNHKHYGIFADNCVQ